ncbi:VRR-NUC domain-containing protein [Agathobaculum sp. NTUH-O15-33]|uniref:VRR-NUC domain-containing protein n=1 Tax=Agathobaculum sp. NTUH-O15-33 TaxID=3079302 RepID=UPI002958A016|nr:VRR-NUC domain-containing protein [Agathobaculum sp. NTUH-O15-33]WNX84380.1 VRR-NUC domain-containing protein [Agathobaculum sp. NTUH-O15-33]
MKESEIEARLVRGVKALGGRAYKFVSPGNVGVPDRLVILPRGRILFAELKADGGRLSRMQLHQIDGLRQLGVEVWEVWGEEGVKGFLELCREQMRGGDVE